jgi:hypothetical protein
MTIIRSSYPLRHIFRISRVFSNGGELGFPILEIPIFYNSALALASGAVMLAPAQLSGPPVRRDAMVVTMPLREGGEVEACVPACPGHM